MELYTERYRPQKLNDIVGQDRNTRIFKNFIETKHFPNLIMYGPKGTGKTSTILSFIKELYGKKYKEYSLFLNASLYNTIKDIREQIGSFTRISSNKQKIIILDESDCLTNDTMYILREMMDTSKNTTLCFICNYPYNLLDIIRSRSFIMFFPPIPTTIIRNHMNTLFKNTTIPESLIVNCNGDLRKALINIQFNTNETNYSELVTLFLHTIHNDFDNLDSIVIKIIDSITCNLIRFYEELNEKLKLKYTNEIHSVYLKEDAVLSLMYIGYYIKIKH